MAGKDVSADKDDDDSWKSIISTYWKDALFIVLLFIYASLTIGLISQLKQMPSPLFGGDYYHSLAHIEHFKSGGSAFVNPALLGGLPSYFPTYTLAAGGIARIFSIEAFYAMKIFAMIEVFMAVIVVYILGSYLFKNKLAAMIFTALYLNLTLFPVVKYLHFTLTFFFPLFILAAYHFYKKQDLLSAVLLGLAYGLVGLSHSVAFITASLFLLIFSLYLLVFQHMKHFRIKLDREFKKQFLKSIKLLLVIALIGGSIAMLYWFKPIFVFHGKPLNPIQDFDQPDFSRLGVQVDFVKGFVNLFLFNFSSLYMSIRTVLFLLSIAGMFFIKKIYDSQRFLLLLMITAVIGLLHFIVTQPILGTNFAADYIGLFSLTLASALFATLGAMMLSSFAKKYSTIVLLVILLLVVAANISQFKAYEKSDQWLKVGRTELAPNMKAMQDWVLSNTDVNDVFLSNNELSFALNALTGRKLVTIKRGHTEMFSDADKNMRQATLMLFSNNTDVKRQLLKERKVKYLYWDINWVNLEYQFDGNGKMTGMFDPFLLLDKPETRALLESNNISYAFQHTWIDPAIKNDNIKQFDALFIIPQNYRDFSRPWNQNLDSYLQEVWNYSQGDTVVSRIFKIVSID
ncbi:MAG: hypothetical protein V1866_02850 [archaeon]